MAKALGLGAGEAGVGGAAGEEVVKVQAGIVRGFFLF
jgi:hypothetical protein